MLDQNVTLYTFSFFLGFFWMIFHLFFADILYFWSDSGGKIFFSQKCLTDGLVLGKKIVFYYTFWIIRGGSDPNAKNLTFFFNEGFPKLYFFINNKNCVQG